MTTVQRVDPQTGVDREVPQADYEREVLQKQVAARSGGAVLDRVRLWDLVDSTWTAPIDRYHAIQYQLRKVIYRCSACTFVGQLEDHVKLHIGNIRQASEDHNGAKGDVRIAQTERGTYSVGWCSACSHEFVKNPAKVHEHIKDMRKEEPRHVNASVQLVRRYSLERPVLPEVRIDEHLNGNSEVDRKVRKQRPRKRKRSRSGKRVAHGNG